KLLGANIIGPRATALMAREPLAIQTGLTREQLDLTIHAHPTLPESLMEAALAAQGRAIHFGNRKSPTPHPAPAAPTSPHGGEVTATPHPAPAAPTSPHGREVTATHHPAPAAPTPPAAAHSAVAKSNNPVVAAVEVSPKALELSKDNKDLLLGLHR